MRLENILQEAKFDRPIIAVHGTSDAFLRSILTNGLMPSDTKTWGAGLGGKENQRDMSSVGGVYLTTEGRTAYMAASQAKRQHGGEPLFVVCQVQPKSLFADEDTVELVSRRGFPGEKVEATEAIAKFLNFEFENQFAYRELEERKTILLDQYPELEGLFEYFPEMENELYYLIKSYYQRIASYYEKGFHMSFFSRRTVDDIYREYFRDRMDKSDFQNFVLEELIPDPSEAEQDYRDELDSFSRRINRILKQEEERKRRNTDSFRFDGVINFRGNNKILTVARIVDNEEDPVIMRNVEIFYGDLTRESERLLLGALEVDIGDLGIEKGHYKFVKV